MQRKRVRRCLGEVYMSTTLLRWIAVRLSASTYAPYFDEKRENGAQSDWCSQIASHDESLFFSLFLEDSVETPF